ncbi:hypothetical protein OAN96_00295 [Candidatus Gracilibacteria bacterium]|nr:hypothetical protein [Candidatus Gracilibacteria bacterium]
MSFPTKKDSIPTKRKELYRLVSDIFDKMKFIDENYNEESLGELRNAHQEIYGIENTDGEYKGGKFQELEEAYSSILEDDEGNEDESKRFGLKTQIEKLLQKIETDKKERIDSYIQKIEGGFKENQEGEKIKEEGLFSKIENLYTEYGKKLEGADTALKLVGIFQKKVIEYKEIENKWSNLFMFIILFILGYYSISTINNESIKSLSELGEFLLLRIPFFAMAIWLLVFIGNRRAEAKKLEESYKHKEVMARAYIGYRESVFELNTTDNELIEKHMENLLSAMSVDSSDFLNFNGENHPFVDLFNNLTKKDIFPDGELNFAGKKISFKK